MGLNENVHYDFRNHYKWLSPKLVHFIRGILDTAQEFHATCVTVEPLVSLEHISVIACIPHIFFNCTYFTLSSLI